MSNPYYNSPSDWKFLSLGMTYDWSRRMPEWWIEEHPEEEHRNKIYKQLDEGVDNIAYSSLSKFIKKY